MRSIDSYDSRYPSEYYEIGTIYSFYGSSNTGNLKPAKAEYISKYSSKLLELQEEEKTSVIRSVGKGSSGTAFSSFQRFYGIVVAKPRDNFIRIMLISIHDGISDFYTKDYAVSFSGCPLDGKEIMPVSSSAKYKTTSGNGNKKVGGITRVNSKSDIGGITRVKTNNKNISAGVGGITRTNKKSITTSTINQTSHSSVSQKVNGITRGKNVGGITRVKK